MLRNFNKAIESLIDILTHVNFLAKVHFVDLLELRKKFKLPEPPKYISTFSNRAEKTIYHQNTKAYEDLLERTIGKNNKFLPLSLILKNSYAYHSQEMSIYEDKDGLSREVKGYLNFESLSGSDTMLISNFHKLRNKIPDNYGEKIVGINFHTKNSLDGGIQLADLIAYISCQTLRFKYKLKSEYSRVDSQIIPAIRGIREIMREDYKIKIYDVTLDTL